ncbi:hypothetical protein N566_02650 [Streptomycetaceae bacterium MP113-05]|nr:hypothetical protein N566_02650 [Streptomycetaceae bacterium MP113-05]
MSYPPQPGQDPNNPYAQQPQGQQPGYGYPQQQQPAAPGYGYPQDQQQAAAPGYGYPQQNLSPYGGYEQGYPMHAGYGVPSEMPGPVKTVRIMNFVLGGLAIVGTIALIVIAALFNDAVNDPSLATDPDASAVADLGTGVFIFLALLTAANAVYCFLCAVKAKTGGNGWRIATIVLGALSVLGGVFSLPTGVVNIALGTLIIVFMCKAEAKAWYNRPRY